MRKIVMLVVAVVVVLSVGAGPAAAGGWAVPAFDPLPPLRAGQESTVGLTVLQHGQHPVSVDGVAVTYVAADGRRHRFEAEAEGPEGHYLATVSLPEGTFEWSVELGFFGTRELGAITVDGGSSLAPSVPGRDELSAGRWLARIVLPLAAAAALAAVVVAGLRPRRRPAPATP
jgi:hypothetical protein